MPPDDIFGVKEYGILVERGKAAYQAGRFLVAMQAWKKAQIVDPSRRGELDGYLAKAAAKQADVHLQRAHDFEKEKEGDKALAVYRQILRLDLQDTALKEEAQEKVRASETRARVMSGTLLLSGLAVYLALVALTLWFILGLD